MIKHQQIIHRCRSHHTCLRDDCVSIPGETTYTSAEETSLCNCSIDYNCSDYSTNNEAQACFNSCGGSPSYNWSGMDGDHDGEPCESLP